MLDPVPTRTINSTSTYYYTGFCPHSGELLKLPRTQEVEQIARDLMVELAREEQFAREGKMYGVLLVENSTGEYYSLKAFSGLLNGEAVVTGWVPPIPGRDQVATAEAATIEDLAMMKQELIDLDLTKERAQYQILAAEFVDRIKQLLIEHRQRKVFRHQERERLEATLKDVELAAALSQLTAQSCQDGRESDRLKQERNATLQPLKELLDQNQAQIRQLKQQRKMRSRQLQTQMHDAYRLMNFLGTSSSLRELMPAGIPTGTGDCCAPKLLHYAASQGLKPIAMAEFWWGDGDGGTRRRGDEETGGRAVRLTSPEGDAMRTAPLSTSRSLNRDWENKKKIQGEFYGACEARCQPLMGFMLAGVSQQRVRLDLEVIYEDEYMIAVDKPAGLLSVPGRTVDLQDSVLTRLRDLYPKIHAVHRLDRDTSGILLFALDKLTYQHLSQQFEARQVHKIYEAILAGRIGIEQGSIDLPLWGDPLDRPRQQVNFELGKSSLTKFQVIAQIDSYTRIEFFPVTGRTHQLRVHAADPQGLGVNILGDKLYGCQADVEKLHLHARELSFAHPETLARISLQAKCPF